MRFGKLAPKHDYRTLRFKSYVTAELPPPPIAFSSLGTVYDLFPFRGKKPADIFPIDGNDTLGDCTIAAMAHAITVFRALVGKAYIPGTHVVTSLYDKLSGGNDTGLVLLDVLRYWRKHRVSTESAILAFVSIDPKNHDHVKQAINLFGGVYTGFQCQQNCLEDFQAKKPWTPGPLTNDGHAIFVPAYDVQKVNCLTWGSLQYGTWPWWDECVDECYAILPIEAEKAGFHSGFDYQTLAADLQKVAS